MNKFIKLINKSFSKQYIKYTVSSFLVILMATISFLTTWAWYTQFVNPRNSDVSISVASTGVSVETFTVQKVNEDSSLDVVFDINDPAISNTFLTGLLIGEEYIFSISITSIVASNYVVSVGMDGVDGGNNFMNLEGNVSTLNMCDVIALKLESITPNSTPAYAGSYDYRWLNESKLTNSKFTIISNFNYWDSSLGNLEIVFKFKVSAELTSETININELSRKSLSISNFFVVANPIESIGGE